MQSESMVLKLSLDNDAEHWLDGFTETIRPLHRRDTNEKLEEFCSALEARPRLGEEVCNSAIAFLETHSLRSMLCESGVDWSRNLFDSILARLLGKILPPPPRKRSVQEAVRQAFDRPKDKSWLERWSDSSLERLGQILDLPADHPVRQKLRIELLSSLEVLSHRLAAMGLDPELVRVAPELERYTNPFLAQSHELSDWLSDSEHGSDDQFNVLLQQCSDVLSRVNKQSKKRGTSLHLTYHLVTTEAIIERLHTLSSLISGRLSRLDLWHFIVSLCIAEHSRHSIRDLIQEHSRVIARQVVHQAGHTGEHYIAHNTRQLRGLFWAAIGGGFVVGIICVIKADMSLIPNLAPLWLTLGYCGNYALGFVILHLLGFTIATKQPAMTAAALAEAMPVERKMKASSFDEVANLCVLTMRSQAVGIAGNVLLAFPTAMLLSVLWKSYFGVPLAPPEKAAHLMHELTPGVSMFYAAVAGVGLYLGGLVSGYFDNLSDFYAVPDRIRNSPQLLKLLGQRVEVWARVAEKNTGAIAGNAFFGIYLGLLSGLVPMLGIPLNVRHVTFSAANLGLVVHSQGFHARAFAEALVGIALIGVVNLTVSFGLALWTAASARGVSKRHVLRLLQALKLRIGRLRPVRPSVVAKTDPQPQEQLSHTQ